MRCVQSTFGAVLLVTVAFMAPESALGIQTCTSSYCVGYCARNCSDPGLGGATTTCEEWLIQNDVAGDSDGVPNLNDNCMCANNFNQADCDNDGQGNVCDPVNGTFVPAGRWTACASDIDEHVGYYVAEVQEHRRYEDASSCNSADRWDRRTLTSYCVPGYPEIDCCKNTCSNSADQGICNPIGQYTCNPDTLP